MQHWKAAALTKNKTVVLSTLQKTQGTAGGGSIEARVADLSGTETTAAAAEPGTLPSYPLVLNPTSLHPEALREAVGRLFDWSSCAVESDAGEPLDSATRLARLLADWEAGDEFRKRDALEVSRRSALYALLP